MRLKFLFFFLPFVLLSQDSFLKNLWIGNSSINNQNFSLNFYGVIYQSEEDEDKYMGFHSTHFFPIKDLNFYLQEPINVSLGNSVSEEEFNSYFLNNFKKINVENSNIFPIFEFIKGKLLTVQNTIGSKSSKDFLFSLSFNDEFPPRMIFNITEESDNGTARTYQIPTKVIDGDVFLLFSNEILYRLGFECSFSGKKVVSLQYMRTDYSSENFYNIDGHNSFYSKSKFNKIFNYSDYERKLNNDNSYNNRVYRVHNTDYIITLERKKDVYSDQNWLLFPYDSHIGTKIDADDYIRDEEYFFLFKLIEQE